MTAPCWNRNFHYHDLILKAMPSPCRAALDVGCGDGTLLRKLAARAGTVVGIDASEAMAERARRNTRDAGADVIHADLLAHDFADRRFDFITCVAAIHHMDFRAALGRMASLLRPGGVLAIVGLARVSTPTDVAFGAAGFVATRLQRLTRRCYDPGAPLVDPAMTYTDVARTAAAMLPDATFRRLLLFRYLLTWTAPG